MSIDLLSKDEVDCLLKGVTNENKDTIEDQIKKHIADARSNIDFYAGMIEGLEITLVILDMRNRNK